MKENLAQVKFDCSLTDHVTLKQAFSRVLDQMDAYFQEHELYAAVDYQQVVEHLLKSQVLKLQIVPSVEMDHDTAGMARVGGEGYLKIDAEKIKLRPEALEKILCHEFIHVITLGAGPLFHTSDNKTFKVVPPTATSRGRRFVVGDDGRNLHLGDITDTTAPGPGLFCEGFTEMLACDIYPQVPHTAFFPQVGLVKFFNQLAGGKQANMVDFLQGYLSHYQEAFGFKLDQVFQQCNELHEEYLRVGGVFAEGYYAVEDLDCQAVFNTLQQRAKRAETLDQFQEVAVNLLSNGKRYVQRYQASLREIAQNITTARTNDPQRQQAEYQALVAQIEAAVMTTNSAYQKVAGHEQ